MPSKAAPSLIEPGLGAAHLEAPLLGPGKSLGGSPTPDPGEGANDSEFVSSVSRIRARAAVVHGGCRDPFLSS